MNLNWMKFATSVLTITVLAHLWRINSTGELQIMPMVVPIAVAFAAMVQIVRQNSIWKSGRSELLGAVSGAALVVGNIILIEMGKASKYSTLAIVLGFATLVIIHWQQDGGTHV